MKQDFDKQFGRAISQLREEDIPPVTKELETKTLRVMKSSSSRPLEIRVSGWQLAAASILVAVNIATGVFLYSSEPNKIPREELNTWIQTYQLDVPTIYDQAITVQEE